MDQGLARAQSRFLNAVERMGNALPDPVAIFVLIIMVLMAMSAIGAWLGWSATNPVTGELLEVKSLFTEDMVRKIFVEMPKTYTGFTPLGLALTVVLGASVAEGSGLLIALLRRAVRDVPDRLLTPAVILIGMLSTHAVDAGYLVYVPLAGAIFAAAGRNPLMGIILGFIGCSVGLTGNLMPGQYDVLILGITETGARIIEPGWTMNPIGNWWFIVAIALTYLGLGWIITHRIAEPRLGVWNSAPEAAPDTATPPADMGLSPIERRGLIVAGMVALLVIAGSAALTLLPGYSPLHDATAPAGQQWLPFFRSIVSQLFVLFIATGWAYGAVTSTIKSHRDVVAMMARGLQGMLPYLVMMFFAAHFVAMFSWSNLGPITAISGAAQLRAMNAPPALLLPLLTTMSAWLDFLIASGSAKWTAMAPVAVPMLMLLDISPEMTTAAYRVGDSVTNPISPLSAYFVLTLMYCQRLQPQFRLGNLLATTLPYSIAFYIAGMLITAGWVAFDLPLGPGAVVTHTLPQALR